MQSDEPGTEIATEQPAVASTEVETAAEQSAEAAVDVESTALVIDLDPVQFLPEVVQPAWTQFTGFPILFALIIVLSGYLIGKAVQYLLVKVLRRLASKTKTDLDDRLTGVVTSPIMQTFVVLSLITVVLMPNMPMSLNQVLIRSLVSLLLFFWARAGFKAAHIALDYMSANRDRFKAIQPRTVPLIEMSLKLFMLGVFAYLFLAIWGIDGTAWLASAGVIGLAVGFAAQDTLANLISGVSIVADAPYKIGDYIVLDSGERGIVTRLGIRSTRLLTRDDVEISIPNAVIGNAKITNESGGPWVLHRIRVPVGVAYGSDTERVVRLLENIAIENTGTISQPAPRVRMRGFGASSLDFELLCWIPRPEMRGLVRHELLMEIDHVFRVNNIAIPFPQRDVHIKGTAE